MVYRWYLAAYCGTRRPLHKGGQRADYLDSDFDLKTEENFVKIEKDLFYVSQHTV